MRKYNEKEVIEIMTKLYCKKQHGSKELCTDCSNLLEYACFRIDKCRYKETKTFCSFCKTPCYKPNMKEQIKTVMKYSGPRLIFKKPILVFNHVHETIKHKRSMK